MKTKELIQIIKDISDYLSVLQAPYEQAIYNYLFRWSYLESGTSTVRKGKRTIAKESAFASGRGSYGSGKVSYKAVTDNIVALEKKGHVKVGDTTREGTLYTILLPSEIEECIKLRQEKENFRNIDNTDYFNVPLNRMKIFERDNYTCHYCGDKVTEDNVTLDHLIPRSKGGDNSRENLVTCCLECNSIKGGRTFQEAAPDLLEKLKAKRARE